MKEEVCVILRVLESVHGGRGSISYGVDGPGFESR